MTVAVPVRRDEAWRYADIDAELALALEEHGYEGVMV